MLAQQAPNGLADGANVLYSIPNVRESKEESALKDGHGAGAHASARGRELARRLTHARTH